MARGSLRSDGFYPEFKKKGSKVVMINRYRVPSTPQYTLLNQAGALYPE